MKITGILKEAENKLQDRGSPETGLKTSGLEHGGKLEIVKAQRLFLKKKKNRVHINWMILRNIISTKNLPAEHSCSQEHLITLCCSFLTRADPHTD